MHGEVGAAVEHGLLHLLDEDAGASHRVDRDVGADVTAGGDDHELHVVSEHGGDSVGLPAGQLAAARRHAQRAGHQSSSSASGSGRPNSSTSASAYSAPRALPAASFMRTVGSWRSLLTMPRVSCSTVSRAAGSSASSLARYRSSSAARTSSTCA